MTAVLPCFYPTTTVLIDDDSYTLKKLVANLALENYPHKAFYDPRQGLEFINQDHYRETFVDRLTTSDEEEIFDNIFFDTKSLLKEFSSPKRYDQVSVVVIDYEMPGMNGLEVSQGIENPFVKRILLTGVADESVAVDAFNRGLISSYVKKQDHNFIDHLKQAIQKAQRAYFQEIFHIPLRMLEKRYGSTALIEPAFIDYFNDIIGTHHIEEYYLIDGTGSFFLIDEGQKFYSLITYDDNLAEACRNSHSAELLPPDKKNAIEQHELLPFYCDPFRPPHFEPADFAKFLRKPTVIKGKTQNFYIMFDEGSPIERKKVVFWKSPTKDS
jgi:CheY-like chemotaxis protein